MKSMSRLFKASLLLMTTLAIAACGFHLRQSAALPPSMQRVHLNVGGGGNLRVDLTRALEGSGVTVEDKPGTGIAELNIPVASFSTDTLTVSGLARVTEYTVRYHVEFEVHDGTGQPLVARQRIDMQREFSYDATNTIGTTAQVQAIQDSLNDDMVQAILFRLQAATKHPGQVASDAAAPASASSTN
jgi:LPS-assembly lipoprotein